MIYFLLLALAESLCSFDCLLLGMNGVCDKECNLKGCVYDNSECGDCSIGCLTEMLGDGICNLECFVDVCDYDVFDCYGGCNDKCTSSMIGDGNCDADCLTEACSFDGDDCLEQCAPGCYDFMIEDWMCESECMTESCGYDIADCNTTVWVTSGANGDGSEAFPYGTIQEALYSIFEGYVNIIVSEGVYYIDETIFLFAQAAVVITGVGNVEVRFLSPNYGIFFYDFALVSVNNITFDGSELFMQGCNEDLCRFIQNWYCADTCVNDFGKEIQSGTIYSIDYYEFCTNSSLLSIFTLENVGKGVFKDITIKNTEFLSNLVKSTGSSLEVSNVFVTHSVVYGSVIHAQSEETVKYKEFQTTNMANIEFYLALWPLTVNVTYVELYDINRISLPFTNPCRIFDYPSAVKTIGIDSVYISDIYFDFLGKSNVVGSDFGLVEIESGTNFHVQNVYSSHLQMQSGSVVFINIFPNFFTVDKSKNFIQNINIENSYIVGGVVRVKTRFTGNELQVTDIQAEKISLNNAAIANLTGVIFSSDIITLKNLLSGKKKEIGECRKTFFQKVTAQDVQLTGPLISFSDFTKLEFSEFYFSDISNQKERFYIDEAFAYFNDKKFFDEQAKLPASLFWIIKSKQNTIDSGSISEVDLDSFIFLLEELQGEYVIGKVIAEKSTTLGFVYLFNNVKSNCYLNELEVYQCEFEGPALEISQNFYVEVSGMVVEGITTAGVSSSSEKILLKSSIFKNNVSVQSMVVLKAQSVNSVATIDGVQFLNNFAPVAADIYIDPILVENNFEVFILNSLFSLSQSALSQSLKVSPNNAIGSILFENVTIHNIAPDDCNF